MKRLNTDLTTSDVGLVLQHKHLDFLQDKTEESLIHSIYSQLGVANTAVVILYGCFPTFTTTTTTDDTLTIAAGAVSYLGKIYEVDAVSIVKTGANVHLLKLSTVTYDASDPSLFTDNVSRDVQEIRKVELAQGVTGSGISDWDDIKILYNVKPLIYVDSASVPTLIAPPKKAVIEIGPWNMDATSSISISHSIDRKKIISAKAMILNDGNTTSSSLETVNGNNPLPTASGGSITVQNTLILLTRTTGGMFDGTTHDDAVMNRGLLTIEYMD